LLERKCGHCHREQVKPFMNTPPELARSLLEWPNLVDLENPSLSELLTKGEHNGPAWTAAQAKTVRRWIALQRSAVRSSYRETSISTALRRGLP
jgi:hypothetical protein